MSDSAEIRNLLSALSPGAKVRVRFKDGSEIAGAYLGFDGDQIQLEDGTEADSEEVNIATVETVLMEVSSSGPE